MALGAARGPLVAAARGFKSRPSTQKRLPALQRKAGDVASSPIASVLNTEAPDAALKKMVSGGFGALIVEDGAGAPHGIVTERDCKGREFSHRIFKLLHTTTPLQHLYLYLCLLLCLRALSTQSSSRQPSMARPDRRPLSR